MVPVFRVNCVPDSASGCTSQGRERSGLTRAGNPIRPPTRYKVLTAVDRIREVDDGLLGSILQDSAYCLKYIIALYSGGAGYAIPGVNPRVDIFEFDGRYEYQRIDFRGLFANVWISEADKLNEEIEHETGHNPNVASQLRGFYLEPAVHLLRRERHQDVIAFARYENYDTQRVMPHGFSAHPEYDRDAWFIGLTYKPTQDIAFKDRLCVPQQPKSDA